MTTTGDHPLSLEELSTTLDAYAGPPRPRTRVARQRWGSRRLAFAIALVTLIFAGCSYAADFNPFRGISAAEHPAGPSDTLPALVKAQIADWNDQYGPTSPKHLLRSTARFVRSLPDGMRFYTIATSGGTLCLGTVHPPKSISPGGMTDQGGFDCGYSLSPRQPITVVNEQNAFVHNGKQELGTPISYGLALDGITAISFSGGPFHVTIPVTHNVWVHLGPTPDLRVTVHWEDGSTQTQLHGGRWSAR